LKVFRPILFSLLFATFAAAQAPRIGLIDFYGLRRVPETKLRQALGAREGDPLPRSKGDTEERLDRVSGVVESHLEAVCCEAGQMILYVGIEERGAPHFDVREPPDAELRLPEELNATYHRFLQASATAARRGTIAEDLTHGHALSADPDTRAIQEQFIELAKDDLKELRQTLRDSSDEEQRAVAAYVIGYAPRKTDIIDDLQYVLKDADAGVRNNAARSLEALAVWARLNPDEGVKVSPTWFIEMLNSLSWSDRNRSMRVLQILTDGHDASVLDQLRERAIGSLVEMARWKALEHALPAYLLVGRIAGLPDQEVQAAWARGDRESVIAQALGKKKRP
jgi:hypothetical protein